LAALAALGIVAVAAVAAVTVVVAGGVGGVGGVGGIVLVRPAIGLLRTGRLISLLLTGHPAAGARLGVAGAAPVPWSAAAPPTRPAASSMAISTCERSGAVASATENSTRQAAVTPAPTRAAVSLPGAMSAAPIRRKHSLNPWRRTGFSIHRNETAASAMLSTRAAPRWIQEPSESGATAGVNAASSRITGQCHM